MSRRVPGPVARRLLRAPVWLYDWNVGWVLGGRFLQLTHVGHRSGKQHRTLLELLGTTRTGEVVVTAGLGRSADWYRNLQVHPQVDVAVGRQKFQAVARTLDEPERIRSLTRGEVNGIDH
jgi:deazaflavin-dependent oxidoreductase (nitroreductase family)